jgi:hypothetical protein
MACVHDFFWVNFAGLKTKNLKKRLFILPVDAEIKLFYEAFCENGAMGIHNRNYYNYKSYKNEFIMS